MTYKVLSNFKALTDRGEMEIQAGQIITLEREKALRLLSDGKIIPTVKVAYRICSEILEAFLWVVDTDEDMKSLRDRSITEPIYTANEIRKLKGTNKEELKEIHKVKEVFENSKIEEFHPKNDQEGS
jgi:hypothetical protein